MKVRCSTACARKPFCSRRLNTVRTVDSLSARLSACRIWSAVASPRCQTSSSTSRSRSPKSVGSCFILVRHQVVLRTVAYKREMTSPGLRKVDWLRNLERDGGRFTAADAQGCDTPLLAAAAQCVNQRRQDARPAGADRVAQG